MIDASTVMRLIVHELGLKRTSQNGGINQQSVTRRSDCQLNLRFATLRRPLAVMLMQGRLKCMPSVAIVAPNSFLTMQL